MTELIPPKTRKIKSKGAAPTRISRRQGGNDSEVIKLSGNNRSTKALIRGGMAGRIKSSDSNWEYFVTSNKATLYYPELPAERNKRVFTNVEEVVEKQNIGNILEPEVDGGLESYHILGLQNISSVVNEMLTCKCNLQQSVLDFIEYCSFDSRVDAGVLCEIFNELKKKKKRTDKSNIYIQTHGNSKYY